SFRFAFSFIHSDISIGFFAPINIAITDKYITIGKLYCRPSALETAKEHSKSNLKKVGKKPTKTPINHQIKTIKML
ncbi:MAG: Unknown protein, partial [uncultured Sulfurovum sp.]